MLPSGRLVSGIRPGKIKCNPWPELFSRLQRRKGSDELIIHERNRRFQAGVAHLLRRSSGCIGFDTSSWMLAKESNKLNIPFILDRTIAHPAGWTRSQVLLQDRYPEWISSAVARPSDIQAAEATEHDLSSKIVVGSEFVAGSLICEGIDPAKIVVNPYGVDWNAFEQLKPAQRDRGAQTRFLFVGSVTARKGVPVLLDAWKRLRWQSNEAELWIVGHCADERRRILQTPGVTVLGPLPRPKVLECYAQCDVLVLPSFLEGFALVLLEAVASGLPLIITPNTGGTQLLDAGVAGAVVEPGNVQELADALRYYHRNPESRRPNPDVAKRLKAQYSWQAYGDRWARIIDELT